MGLIVILAFRSPSISAINIVEWMGFLLSNDSNPVIKMAIKVKLVERLIHYYELNFSFQDEFFTSDGDQSREFFAMIKKLATTRAKIRYQQLGPKAIFIQDVTIKPVDKVITGKLRCVRKDILPELMNTVTDEARGIEAKDEEGLVETTHFIIDFSRKKKRLAIEFNQFGARIDDFIMYLEQVGMAIKATKSVGFAPMVKDELKTVKERINKCSEFIVKVHKDNISAIQDIDAGLWTSLNSSIAHYKSEYGLIRLKFDYRERTNTKEIKSTIDKLVDALIKDKNNVELFNTLEVKAEDSEKNNRLEIFDLLVDKIKHKLKVEKNPRYRTVVSNDMFPKMEQKLKAL